MDAKQIIIKFDEEQLDRILQSYSNLLNQSSAYIVGALYLITKLQKDGSDIDEYWDALYEIANGMLTEMPTYYDTKGDK